MKLNFVTEIKRIDEENTLFFEMHSVVDALGPYDTSIS